VREDFNAVVQQQHFTTFDVSYLQFGRLTSLDHLILNFSITAAAAQALVLLLCYVDVYGYN